MKEKIKKTMADRVEDSINILVNSDIIGADQKEEVEEVIKDLVHRVMFPENYCPECDKQMFFNEGRFVCECGYDQKNDKDVEIAPKKSKNNGESIRKLKERMDGGGAVLSEKDIGTISEVPAGAASRDVKWV